MKEKRNDIYSSVAFILFAGFMFAGSYWIPPTTSDILGSRFFPRMVAFLIAFLAVFQLIGAVSFVKSTKEEVKEEKKTGLNMSLILTVAALFAYYVLVLYVGFTITSILYLLAQSAILMSKDDFKNKKKIIILALVAVLDRKSVV